MPCIFGFGAGWDAWGVGLHVNSIIITSLKKVDLKHFVVFYEISILGACNFSELVS